MTRCASCIPCLTRTGPCRLGTRQVGPPIPRRGPLPGAIVRGGKDLPSVAAGSDITARILDAIIRPTGQHDEGYAICRRNGCADLSLHPAHDEEPLRRPGRRRA